MTDKDQEDMAFECADCGGLYPLWDKLMLEGSPYCNTCCHEIVFGEKKDV